MFEKEWSEHVKPYPSAVKNKHMVKAGLLKQRLAQFADDCETYVYSDTGETSTGELYLILEHKKERIGSINLHTGEVRVET